MRPPKLKAYLLFAKKVQFSFLATYNHFLDTKIHTLDSQHPIQVLVGQRGLEEIGFKGCHGNQSTFCVLSCTLNKFNAPNQPPGAIDFFPANFPLIEFD